MRPVFRKDPNGRAKKWRRPSLGRSARHGATDTERSEDRANLDATERTRKAGRPVVPSFLVETVCRGSRHTLRLTGALDLNSLSEFEAAVSPLWPHSTAITQDLRELVFIDSSGLWAISAVAKWCARKPIEFSLIPGPRSVQSVFEMTGLSDILPFETGRTADTA